MAPWAYLASVAYHDLYWYPHNGNDQVYEVLKSHWGRLFHNWEKLTPDEQGFDEIGLAPIGRVKTTGDLLKLGAKVFATAAKEAPESRAYIPWLKK
jgi:hypothetical protein